MDVYGEFAAVYSRGDYPDFSRQMAEHLPGALEQLGVRPESLLDIACGEGTFAVAVARQGLEVTGVDASPQMIECAMSRAEEAGVGIDFRVRMSGQSSPNCRAFSVYSAS